MKGRVSRVADVGGAFSVTCECRTRKSRVQRETIKVNCIVGYSLFKICITIYNNSSGC